MKLADYIKPENVIPNLDVSSKTQVLQAMSASASQLAAVPADTILNALLKRENLGSTGVGQGVALPLTRIAGISRPVAMIARLKQPIDFESIDGKQVDIVFLSLTPDEEPNKHLNVLACVSRKLRAPGVLDQMRAAKDAASLYSCFIEEL
ncbi:PTS sugar transporter subunit IIA [Phyllobacterium bourgognense]|uniref:Phosphotransferase IIA-like nitrogen-regulatory protein PtsN n=1 Tax=Phyllobacterium bourgognense TaxID=314236 RepID=A0A368YTJ3_9HYPH|nr:PTS sugar transporter subunit IIA [Phyllobacterium bourgognense]RCW81494.1 phosphotransferase IIA-like nitrogen-regulatory protein PtsN [Phyllobacterium bourgognense]